MAKLVFCDYHNMVSILEKTKHNTYFYQIVDFLEASHIRIETMNQETKILATVDGKPQTISESSLRRHLKLNDEEGISSLPDTEIFENLSLMDEPASLSRDDRQGEAFLTVSSLDVGQDRENIAKTSTLPHESSSRVPSLSADKGRGIIDIGEELGVEKSTEKRTANILSSGGAAASVSPADVLPAAGVPTVSGSFPIPMRIPIIRAKDKGKEKVIEAEVPKKRKLQEQIDAQVAREREEEIARENQRLSEKLARDFEIARLHAKEELKIMIKGLDRSNEVIAKHLSEYEQAEADLSIGEKIELINFVLMSSKEESERVKRQGLKIDQGSSKRIKISEEELKGMMQLVPLEKFYIEALHVKHPIIDWEIHSEGKRKEDLYKLWTLVKETFSTKQATRDKEKELWTELKRLFEPDFED
nr:hypothetical protein [Tanacetum cinerariifolium]